MKVVALAGGVGGAKLARGLAQVLPSRHLTIIVNTADDFEHFGLQISPDLDTVCYTLAGIADPENGWGQAGDTWTTLKAIDELGGPSWFRIGDRDWATHLERTRRLRQGETLSDITRDFCLAWGVQQTVLPMTNDSVQTKVKTEVGELAFQEYFVHQRCKPAVQGFRLQGAEAAHPAPGVVEAIVDAELVIICPSNPWVSIGPILSIRGIRSAIVPSKAVAISPIVAGKTIKGPAAKMYSELSIAPSALAVARHYHGIIEHFVMDKADSTLASAARNLGLHVMVANTIMKNAADATRLSRSVLDFVLHSNP